MTLLRNLSQEQTAKLQDALSLFFADDSVEQLSEGDADAAPAISITEEELFSDTLAVGGSFGAEDGQSEPVLGTMPLHGGESYLEFSDLTETLSSRDTVDTTDASVAKTPDLRIEIITRFPESENEQSESALHERISLNGLEHSTDF